MSHKFTDALSETNGVVDLSEKHDSKIETSRNPGNLLFEKHTAEDDINRLFKSINIGRAIRGVPQKSAVKGPMKVGPPSSGISETLDFKRALRGLCISQASEMAAVKKRLLRPSKGSLGVPSTLDIKERMYRVFGVEARELGRPIDEGLENAREVLLVSGKSTSVDSVKLAESRHLFVPGSNGKRQKDKLWGESKGIEPPSKALDASRQRLKSLNLAKKKIVPKAGLVTRVVGDETSDRKAKYFMDKGWEELGKSSFASSSKKIERFRFSQPKSGMIKAGEYSRSRENEGFSQSSKSSKKFGALEK